MRPGAGRYSGAVIDRPRVSGKAIFKPRVGDKGLPWRDRQLTERQLRLGRAEF